MKSFATLPTEARRALARRELRRRGLTAHPPDLEDEHRAASRAALAQLSSDDLDDLERILEGTPVPLGREEHFAGVLARFESAYELAFAGAAS